MKNGHVQGTGTKENPYIMGVYGFKNPLETGLVLSDINNWHNNFIIWTDNESYHEIEKEYLDNSKPLSKLETQKLLESLKARDVVTQELNPYSEYQIVSRLSDLLSFHHAIVKYCPIEFEDSKLNKGYSILVLTSEQDEQGRYLVVDVLQDEHHYISKEDLWKLYKPSRVRLDADDKGLISQYLDFFTTKFEKVSMSKILGIKMHTYAAEYTYGSHIRDAKGKEVVNVVYRFDSIRTRDEWIAKRKTEFRTNSGYRGYVPARLARNLGFIDYVA